MDFTPEEYDEILNILKVESDEIIQKMNADLLLLEKENNNSEIINKLFREAHNLKGSLRMVGYTQIQVLAHRLEDFLSGANDGAFGLNSEIITAFYRILDYISALIQSSVEQKQEYITDEFENYLQLIEEVTKNQELKQEKDVPPPPNLTEFYKDNSKTICYVMQNIVNWFNEYATRKDGNIAELTEMYDDLKVFFDNTAVTEEKNLITKTISKLKFVQAASGYLISDEIKEILNDFEKLNIGFKTLANEESGIEIPVWEDNNEQNELCLILDKLPLIDENEVSLACTDTLKKITGELLNTTDNIDFLNVYKNIYEKLCNYTNTQTSPEKNVLKIFSECIKKTGLFANTNDYTNEDIQELLDKADSAILNTQNQPFIKNLQAEVTLSDKVAEKKFVKTKDFFNTIEHTSIKTLRVDMQKLDNLVNQMSELIVSKIKIQNHLNDLKKVKNEIVELFDEQTKMSKSVYKTSVSVPQNMVFKNKLTEIKKEIEKIYDVFILDSQYYDKSISELDDMIKNIRVLPVATLFYLFPRMVRDISTEKKKEIEIFINGAGTVVDKNIMEEIKSPLIHIIRNAIDHGIELPDERERKGKPRNGKIVLSAKNLSNKIIIEIKDDGNGLNLEKIKRKALSSGLLTEAEISRLSDEQIMNLVFLPGFSTGENITEISGRGIGLDVVQSKISKLNGKVSVFSKLGFGATVRIELPVTMATIHAFIVESHSISFAVPLLSISAVKIVDTDKILDMPDGKKIIIDNQTIAVYNLGDILGLSSQETEPKQKIQILLLEADEKTIGIIIDKIEGNFEIIQKKFSPPVFKIRHIAGVTALTSGRICYVLNISDIFKTVSNSENKNYIDTKSRIRKINTISEQHKKKILIFDNTGKNNPDITILKSILEDYVITDKLEEVISYLDSSQYYAVSFILDNDFSNVISLLKKLKQDELYQNLPIAVTLCTDNEKIKKEFETLNLKKLTFVSQIESDIFVYNIKQLLD